MMQTEDSTWAALKNGPVYADFERQRPTLVWVVEYAYLAPHRALEIQPYLDAKVGSTLVWALVEASCVSRSRGGISVSFWKNGATGWYPYGNARLPEVSHDQAR